MSVRTQEEIVAAIHASTDPFGFETQVWVSALDYEHAKPYLDEGVSETEWIDLLVQAGSDEDQMRDYMDFAREKALDHRGLSAGRSIAKLNAWGWLLGFDPIDEPYRPYGVPILKALADRHGFEWPEDDVLDRMAQGLPCHPECTEC